MKKQFMPNLAEHESLNASSINVPRNAAFSSSDKPRMVFVLHINVKMTTIVGILTFMSR